MAKSGPLKFLFGEAGNEIYEMRDDGDLGFSFNQVSIERAGNFYINQIGEYTLLRAFIDKNFKDKDTMPEKEWNDLLAGGWKQVISEGRNAMKEGRDMVLSDKLEYALIRHILDNKYHPNTKRNAERGINNPRAF